VAGKLVAEVSSVHVVPARKIKSFLTVYSIYRMYDGQVLQVQRQEGVMLGEVRTLDRGYGMSRRGREVWACRGRSGKGILFSEEDVLKGIHRQNAW
jgi:hypothetical protein